jgi:hypothetical protein
LTPFAYIKGHRFMISFIKVRYLTLCVCAGFFFEPDFNACLKLLFVPLYAATRIG